MLQKVSFTHVVPTHHIRMISSGRWTPTDTAFSSIAQQGWPLIGSFQIFAESAWN
jgi:hypothetical protein